MPVGPAWETDAMRRRSGSAGREGWATRTAAVAGSLLAGLLAVPGPALAQDGSPSPDAADGADEVEVPEPVPGDELCTLADQRLGEVSGLVATGDQYIVINDSQDFGFEDRQPVFFLDKDCQVVDQQVYPSRPWDPEALEYDPDANVLWIGDTGDNASGVGGGEGEPRPTTALWRMDLAGDRTPVIHRFVYPDGQMRDAEALLLDSDGVPIIVTKELNTAGLYQPTEVVPNNPPEQAVQLELVGEVSLPDTGTEHFLGAVGRQVITGAAVAPDRSRVVLRTYADAFEFDVADGDIVGAITDGEPRITPLPDEPQGETITYTPNGKRFLTISEIPEQQPDYVPTLLRYDRTEPPPPSQPAPAEGTGGGDSGRGFLDRLQLQDIINVIAAVGVLGLILVGVGVFGIVRSRRRAAAAGPDADGPEEREAPVTGRVSVGNSGAAAAAGAAGTAGVAGAAAPEPGWEPGMDGGHQPGVYASGTAAGYGGTEYGGTEYGGTGYGGAEYGGAEYAAGGYGGNEYGGNEYGGNEYGGREYGGTEYGGREYGGAAYGGSEYAGEYGDTGHGAAGYGDHRGTEYGGPGYGGREYGGAYRDEPYDQDWPQGGAHGSDYYSEDPDYPYEFRGRDPGRW